METLSIGKKYFEKVLTTIKALYVAELGKKEANDQLFVIGALGGNITLASNNQKLETKMVLSQADMIHDFGPLGVKIDDLLPIIKAIKDRGVDLEIGTDQITIKTSKTSYKLPATTLENIVEIKSVSVVGEYVINQPLAYCRELQKVIVAAASFEPRNILSGVSMSLAETEGALELAATDGNRLMTSSVPVSEVIAFRSKKEESDRLKGNIVMPVAFLELLMSVLDLQDSGSGPSVTNLRLRIMDDNSVVFEAPGVFLSSPLIEGRYPVYKKLIPINQEKYMLFDLGQLIASLKQLAPAISPRTNLAKLEVAGNDVVNLIATDKNRDVSSTTQVGVIDQTGIDPGFKIAFNLHYLLQILNVLNSKNKNAVVKIIFGDSNLAPVLLNLYGYKNMDDAIPLLSKLKPPIVIEKDSKGLVVINGIDNAMGLIMPIQSK
jgi:DNA polymerase-3 subunit beta